MLNRSDSGQQGSKVGLNLQNFMQLSNMEPVNRKQPTRKHKFDGGRRESQGRKQMASRTQNLDQNLNLKNRARSQNVRGLNSTGGGRKESSSVRAGLHSFIKESNIDLDVLSANLSQRKENQRGNSRSKSDRSRRTIGSNNKPLGPGLPLPRSLAASKKMAQQYRQGALARKLKLDNDFTPEHESHKDLPQPVEQP